MKSWSEWGRKISSYFGLTADEVRDRHHNGYHPGQIIEENELLSNVLNEIAKGTFSGGDTERFSPLLGNLYHHDYFMIAADFESYMERQRDVGAAYRDYHRWFRSAMVFLNTANVGWFSSDRTIREYDRDIWHSKPVPSHLSTPAFCKTAYESQ